MTSVVALLNNDLEFGVAVNALAHMAAGLSAALADAGSPPNLVSMTDASGTRFPNIADVAMDIRFGDSNAIRKLRGRVIGTRLVAVDFTRTMTGDTYAEQLERTRATPETELYYYGMILAGATSEVSELMTEGV